MSGRHAASSEHPSRHTTGRRDHSRRAITVTIVVIVVVIMLAGGAGWAVVVRQPPENAAMSGTMPTAMNGSPRHSSTAAPAKVINCREQVRAGDRAVTSARKSYQDWYIHVKAEFDLDKGKITLDKANQIWDRTHKLGSDDMAAFDGNYIVWQNQQDACSKVPTDVPAKWADDVRNCKARAKVIDKTLAAGRDVADDWEAHTIQHRGKETADPGKYHSVWMDMVRKAPKHLKAFRHQYAKYKKAPECFPEQGK